MGLPTPYTDPIGDAGAAADIGAVYVTNDDAGEYTFAIAFGSPLQGSDVVDLYIDADDNPDTGDPSEGGAEYLISSYSSDHTYSFSRWNGSSWQSAESSTVNVTLLSDTALVFSAGRSDLGGTSAFGFWLGSWDGNQSSPNYDDYAPDYSASWEYRLVRLSVVGAHATRAKAGRAWTVAAAVARSDTGRTVGAEGAIACSASSGATRLPLELQGFFSSGSGGANVATCVFAVPKRLRHKLVHATITVSYGGVSATRTFRARVK